MTSDEKAALVQFMGQLYGESKKHDQMLVGQSTNLQPKSNEVKQQFEQVLRSPVSVDEQSQRVPQQPTPAQSVATLEQTTAELASVGPSVITPEQAAAELAQVQQEQSIALVPNADKTGLEEVVYQAPAVDPNQLEFDLTEPTKLDRLIELIEQQNKILLEIKNNSIKSKHGTTRVRNKKPQ